MSCSSLDPFETHLSCVRHDQSDEWNVVDDWSDENVVRGRDEMS